MKARICVILLLANGENYPLPARNFKVKYLTRLGKKYEIPDLLDTRKFQKMKYPTHSIPGKSLPDPSLVTWIEIPNDLKPVTFWNCFLPTVQFECRRR